MHLACGGNVLPKVCFAVAIWTRRYRIVDTILAAICQTHSVVYFKVGSRIRPAQEGRWKYAKLACAV